MIPLNSLVSAVAVLMLDVDALDMVMTLSTLSAWSSTDDTARVVKPVTPPPSVASAAAATSRPVGRIQSIPPETGSPVVQYWKVIAPTFSLRLLKSVVKLNKCLTVCAGLPSLGAEPPRTAPASNVRLRFVKFSALAAPCGSTCRNRPANNMTLPKSPLILCNFLIFFVFSFLFLRCYERSLAQAFTTGQLFFKKNRSLWISFPGYLLIGAGANKLLVTGVGAAWGNTGDIHEIAYGIGGNT